MFVNFIDKHYLFYHWIILKNVCVCVFFYVLLTQRRQNTLIRV